MAGVAVVDVAVVDVAGVAVVAVPVVDVVDPGGGVVTALQSAATSSAPTGNPAKAASSRRRELSGG
ncbi:MAG: hypothetical protein ACRCW4_02595, partial [Candidatus Neomicrothrix subdominans]